MTFKFGRPTDDQINLFDTHLMNNRNEENILCLDLDQHHNHH